MTVKPAADRIDLSDMDEPWLLVWWGDKTPGFPLPLGADLNQNVLFERHRPYDFPLIILLQNRADNLSVKDDRWTLEFDSEAGTAAQTRVLLTSTNGHRSWNTVGCSTNIIDASWTALEDALEYGLLAAG